MGSWARAQFWDMEEAHGKKHSPEGQAVKEKSPTDADLCDEQTGHGGAYHLGGIERHRVKRDGIRKDWEVQSEGAD